MYRTFTCPLVAGAKTIAVVTVDSTSQSEQHNPPTWLAGLCHVQRVQAHGAGVLRHPQPLLLQEAEQAVTVASSLLLGVGLVLDLQAGARANTCRSSSVSLALLRQNFLWWAH